MYAPTVEATSQKLLSHEVMAQISLTRTRLDILPNLNTLVWRPHSSAANSSTGSPTLNDGLLFMHSAVTNFTFSHLNATAEPYANYFLGDIAPRMPHLTHLNFHSSEAVAKVESGICDLVKGLHGVTTIRLPAYYLTTPVAEALSVLPCLRVLVVGHGRPEDTYPIQPNLEFRPVLLPSSFKSLKNLALNMHVADARKVISTIPSSPGLGLLFVMFRTTNPPLDIRKLLEACAQTQRTIRYLTLIPDRSSIRRDLTEGDRGSLEFPHLMPLMQLTMLNQLTIDHPSPLFLSVADVTSIVNSLPLLQSLRLNPEPVHPQTSPLGLDVLAVIARNCPLLVNLGLFVDATLPTESIPHDLTFQRLTSLALGPSVINKEACHPIALYLSALLPGKCRISYKAWWIDVARRECSVLTFAYMTSDYITILFTSLSSIAKQSTRILLPKSLPSVSSCGRKLTVSSSFLKRLLLASVTNRA